MKLLTLKEISDREPGEIVPAFRCQIKEVKPVKSGSNDYGPWTIQSVTVMDWTGIMKVKLFNQPEYTAQWNGVWIVIESTPNDKGSLRGIKVAADDYRGKVTKFVEVKDGATIAQATDSAPPAEAVPIQPAKMPPPVRDRVEPLAPNPAPQQTAAAPAQDAPPQQAATLKANGQHSAPRRSADDIRQSIADAKMRLGQGANGLIMAYDAAIYIAKEVMKNHPDVPAMFTPDVLEKLAVHLSIALERGGLVFGLPAGPLEGWTKKAQETGQSVTPPDTAEGGVG